MAASAQKLAHQAVAGAVRTGVLAPVTSRLCIGCGTRAANYHHPRGYEGEWQLDVEPYCTACHRALHGPPTAGRRFPNRARHMPLVRLIHLQALREARALTQVELARKSGVSRATLAAIEAGKSAPRPGTVRRLAAALAVEPEQLSERPY